MRPNENKQANIPTETLNKRTNGQPLLSVNFEGDEVTQPFRIVVYPFGSNRVGSADTPGSKMATEYVCHYQSRLDGGLFQGTYGDLETVVGAFCTRVQRNAAFLDDGGNND